MADNNFKYWQYGFPFGAADNTDITGDFKYWSIGFPYVYVFQSTAATTTKVYAFIIG